MYAYVKFLKGGEKEIVKTSFIKDFDPENVRIGQEVLVFWSEVEDQTPDDIWQLQGHVADIESSKAHEANKPGYYRAELLLLNDTEDELMDRIESKRVRERSSKLSDGAFIKSSKDKTKTQNKRPHDQLASSKKKASKSSKKEIIESEKKNIGALVKPKKPKSSKKEKYDSPSSTDDEVKPVKKYEEEIKNLKEMNKKLRISNEKLQSKNENLEDENDKLKELNYELQSNMRDLKLSLQTLKNAAKKKKSPQTTPRKQTPKSTSKLTGSSPGSLLDFNYDFSPMDSNGSATCKYSNTVHPEVAPVKKNLFSCDSPASNSFTNESPSKSRKQCAEISPAKNSPIRNSPAKNSSTKNSPAKNSPDKNSHAKILKKPLSPKITAPKKSRLLASTSKSLPLITSTTLTAEQEKFVNISVRSGESGDQLYAKNVAVGVFGRDYLRRHSVKGQPSRRFKKAIQKPKLSPNRYDLVKALCKKRIKEEGVSKEDCDRRMAETDEYVRQKISTLNKKTIPVVSSASDNISSSSPSKPQDADGSSKTDKD